MSSLSLQSNTVYCSIFTADVDCMFIGFCLTGMDLEICFEWKNKEYKISMTYLMVSTLLILLIALLTMIL